MNYRIAKTNKSNVIHFQFNKNTTHNKASIVLINFINNCRSFINSLFISSNYTHDEDYPSRPCNRNLYHEDINDLRLKASQRTFL